MVLISICTKFYKENQRKLGNYGSALAEIGADIIIDFRRKT